jgi:type IV secretory pathway VirB10-like protein
MTERIEWAPRWQQHKWTVFGLFAFVLVGGLFVKHTLFAQSGQSQLEDKTPRRPIAASDYAERTEAARRRLEAEENERRLKAERERERAAYQEEQNRVREAKAAAEKPSPLVQKLQQLQIDELDAIAKAGSGKPNHAGQSPSSSLHAVRADRQRAEQLRAQYRRCLDQIDAGDPACAQTLTGGRSMTRSAGGATDPYIVTPGHGLPVPPGTKILVTLDQSMTSDLLGPFSVTVTQPVYDPAGRIILIPAGAVITGETTAANTVNEVIAPRVSARMTWLAYPDGRSLDLSQFAAALDATGQVGVPGNMDWHAGTIATGALISLLFSSPGYFFDGGGGILSPQQGALNGLNATANRTGQRIAERYLSVQPSKTPEAGEPLVIMIRAPLTLPPYQSVEP